MENIYIFKELKSEFLKYVDANNEISETKAQKASWKFGIYPSTSQVFEVHTCRTEDSCSHNLEFYEYCMLIAIIKNEIDKSDGKPKYKIVRRSASNRAKSRWDVFLGGACNPTTWRFDVAIPFLKEKNITFYNPQVSKWDPSLIDIEENAKQTARVQLFVLDIYRTRGIASLVEAAYLSGQGRNLVLVVPAERPRTITEVDVTELNESEFQSINRSYLFIADLVQRQGIPLFTSVADALKATRISLISNCNVQDLTEIDGIIPVKHAYANISNTVRTLRKTFDELDTQRPGVITITEVKKALCGLFGRNVNPISVTKDTFTFPDFCIEYSVLLLNSILHHQETTRSQSAVNFPTRSTSLEIISSSEKVNTLQSVINIKQQLAALDEDDYQFSSDERKRTKKSLCCKCVHKNGKISTCVKWIMKWPFSKISTASNEISDQPNSRLSVRLVPKLLIGEEKYDIFLGGTCGNSDWRQKVAIPLLEQAGCTFYDPKVSNSVWSRRLLPMEAKAREQSKVLIYVITSDCTSTAALVEAAHFIGQGKKVVLHIQFLPSMCSPPLTPIGNFLQSSCSFPFSSTTNSNPKSSSFFPIHNTESNTTGYQSASDTSASGILTSNSQFSLPPISNKLSISDAGHLDSIDDIADLSMSFNNISKINPLPAVACNDHNRGRKYLIDVAMRSKVPILCSIEETVHQAIQWSQRASPSHSWAKKSVT